MAARARSAATYCILNCEEFGKKKRNGGRDNLLMSALRDD